MTQKPIPQVFKQAVSALAMCIIVAGFYAQKGDKPKTAFQQVSGNVTAVDNIYEAYRGKDTAKYRNVYVDSYEKPFQLFIGKSSGDFKPALEKIDDLQVNDVVTVYYDESNKTRYAPVNNLAYFIDRGIEPIFIMGNSKKVLLYGLMVFCVLCIGGLLLLKKLGKIE